MVVAAIKGIRDRPLAAFLSAKGKNVAAYPVALSTASLRLPVPRRSRLCRTSS